MSVFIDQATIEVRAGDGGDGRAGFRREKFIPKGGPDGGDGGNGGNVIVEADYNLTTLLDFKYQRLHEAQSGEPGGKAIKTGKSGGDVLLKTPVGTLVIDTDTGEVLADLDEDEKSIIAARGGNGGWGNVHFKSSINRAPRRANKGQPGQARKLTLELKLMADVGVVGFPNVGKSTFVSRVSNARPKIANYPFTTLVPNLGAVEWAKYKSFYIADIPGLIEGAADGKGLGHQFLRHVERTRLLIHLLDPAVYEEGRDPVTDYLKINKELERFSADLVKRPQIVAINKSDTITDKAVIKQIEDQFQNKLDLKPRFISCATGEGIESLKKLAGYELETMKKED
ncbi:GTP-binding protein Obg [hydrothermal vent metagenome]|uniref:GTP-binding protein Obg n=1 Tax=hydrothermal vent metagenome TaxID=652676 RepID=A0A3B1C3B4_9ZZZZ